MLADWPVKSNAQISVIDGTSILSIIPEAFLIVTEFYPTSPGIDRLKNERSAVSSHKKPRAAESHPGFKITAHMPRGAWTIA